MLMVCLMMDGGCKRLEDVIVSVVDVEYLF